MRLTAEQVKAAEYSGSGAYAIKGVAGSGKTSVGLYRIAYLLENRCPEPDDRVLMLTFNRTLIRYLQFMYERFREALPRQLRIGPSLSKEDDERVLIDTINSLTHLCYEAALREKNIGKEILWHNDEAKEIRRSTFLEAILKTRETYPHEKVLDEKLFTFLLDEVNWIKASMSFPVEVYLQAERKGAPALPGNQGIPKNSSTRSALFSLYRIYTRLLYNRGYHEFIDTEVAALKYLENHVTEQFTHIIVDESQDLNRLQLEFLKKLLKNKPYSSITFLYDTSQSIYPNSWVGMGNTLAAAGYDITGKSRFLRKNFRSSNEILTAARSMLEAGGMPPDEETFYCNKSGIRPLIINSPDEQNSLMEMVKLVRQLSGKFGLRDISITSRYRKDLLAIRENLELEGIHADIIDRNCDTYATDSVKLITLHSFKGIESEVVIVAGLFAERFPYLPDEGEVTKDHLDQERRLLYVAMTRATSMLFLFSGPTPTPFLEEIEPALVRQVKTLPAEPVEKIMLVAEEPTLAYSIEDTGSHLKLINNFNLRFSELYERLEKLDKDRFPESRLFTGLLDFLKQTNINSVETDENRDPASILSTLLDELTRKNKENEQLSKQVNDVLAANKNLSLPKEKPGLGEFRKDMHSRFPLLTKDLVENLANAEFYFSILENKETDYSLIYQAYCKVIEALFRQALPLYGIRFPRNETPTLGKLFGKLIDEADWKPVLYPLSEIDFINTRNKATHSSCISHSQLNELRILLFDRNLLGRMAEMVA